MLMVVKKVCALDPSISAHFDPRKPYPGASPTNSFIKNRIGYIMRKAPLLLVILLLLLTVPGDANLLAEGGGRVEEGFRYHTLDEARQLIHEAVEGWEIARIVNSTSLGIEGDEILSVILGNNSSAPVLLVVGTHHGDEPVSGEIPLYFLLYLREMWEEGDATLRYLLDHARVVVVPVLNPWGFEYGIRWDSSGQDINRDYPYDPAPAEEHNDGSPLSTAGAQFMEELFRAYSPELALSFHSGRRFIIYPWGCSAHFERSPDHTIFEEVAGSLAEVASGVGGEMPSLEANTASGVSYIKGTWLDWAYAASWDLKNTVGRPLPSSTLSFTVEISEEKAPEENLLGSWDEIEEGGGGYVSEGVRMCLRALHLTTPGVEVLQAEGGSIRIRVHGDPSPSEPQLISLDPPGLVEFNYTSSEGLLGREYTITFDPTLSGTFMVRVPFGDYLFENESAKSTYYGRRRSGYVSTPPLLIKGVEAPRIWAKVVGPAEAAGSVEVLIEGADNFTLLEATLVLDGEEYNLTSGVEVTSGGLKLHLPPASGNGTLSLDIICRGELRRLALPLNVTPSVHLGGVPRNLPAGSSMTVVPFIYGTPPSDMAMISLWHEGGAVVNYTCPLFTSVNVTTPFVLGNLTLSVTCGPYSRSYTVNLTYALHTVILGVNFTGDVLEVGPVFISAPGPSTVNPEEVHVMARIVRGDGVEVKRVFLTYSKELEPDFEDPLLPSSPGGYYAEVLWREEGSYRVILSITYPGGAEEMEAGGFTVQSGGEEVRGLFTTIAVAIIISLASLVVLLLHQIRALKRYRG